MFDRPDRIIVGGIAREAAAGRLATSDPYLLSAEAARIERELHAVVGRALADALDAASEPPALPRVPHQPR